MRIHIRIEDMAFERSLANIAALFDEDASVTAGPNEAADAEWTVAVGVEDLDVSVRARAVLTEAGGGAPIQAEQVRAVPDGASDEERRAVRRQAAGAALLDALERRTGIVQPWGILTGVRPTKLLHDRNLRGVSREESPAGAARTVPDQRREDRAHGADRGPAARRHSRSVPSGPRGQPVYRHSVLSDEMRLLHVPGLRHQRPAGVGGRFSVRAA